jgi:electron transport complex protein RnfB
MLRDRLLEALPQTQCTRCGYPDCAAYAQAIAEGEAAINQCPPGGQAGVARLAHITGLPELPLNPEFGLEGPRHVAWIDEDWCIGCTLCLPACPTDAILGTNKRMHTVIESACTGCELCIPVCPVDCIQLEDVSSPATGWQAWSPLQAQQARERYDQHQHRQERIDQLRAQSQLKKLDHDLEALQADAQLARDAQERERAQRKHDIVAAALARAKAQRSDRP